jgi:hypothetical protein
MLSDLFLNIVEGSGGICGGGVYSAVGKLLY